MIPDTWNKEIGAMRIRVIIFIAAVMLTGCAHLDIQKKIDALERVQPGDTQASVFNTMGPPDLRKDFDDNRFVAFYQTKAGGPSDTSITTDVCTPIAFENGMVVDVGNDLTGQWLREKEERSRRAEIAERERQEAEMAESARRRAEQEHQAKIDALEEEVRPVPGSNAALNLKLYRQLLDLDPDNSRYQKKVAFYEERLVAQKKARQERALRKAREKRRREWDQARDARNVKLRNYTGNGTAEMAVHDMGRGSLYVWVKNVSNQIITTHPDYFTLLDSENKQTPCEISDSLDSVLEPGGISHGKIEFNGEVEPRELIFQNRESGRISKVFE
jgi:outer membrane protein assembly factor BamE (lipoprotein component of BamABCDE complex)